MRVTAVFLKYRPEFHGHIPTFRGRVEIGLLRDNVVCAVVYLKRGHSIGPETVKRSFHPFLSSIKDRYVPKITKGLKMQYWRETSYEMEAMKYLSKPFITEVQEISYLQSVQRTQPEYWDDYLNKKMMIPLRQRYAADLMAPLDRSRNIEEQD